MRAGRLFSEVHQIARVYGWGEAEILRLHLRRRMIYLELIERDNDAALIRDLIDERE
jgi:hypothetical protein